MSVFSNLFGEKLVKDGAEIESSSLDSKDVVGIYFSAHWCPPCRAFTPVLVQWYRDLTASGRNMEIVFASSDRDQAQFDEYFGEMPWAALPFSERAKKSALSKAYGVSGIPTLVLLDGKGNLLTDSGRRIVDDDPKGENYPWTPPTLQEALGSKLLKGGKILTPADLAGKKIGLYFSAHWCGPCRGFTPRLAETYKKLEAAGENFEIIFVSSDSDQAQFDEYFAEMPWAALPYDNRDGKAALSERFKVEGIPTFVMLDDLESGRLINPDARGDVSSDPEGANFPWHPKSLNFLEDSADGINDNVSIIALLGEADPAVAESSIAALKVVADTHYAAARQANKLYPDSLRFFAAKTGGGVIDRVKQLTKASGPTLLVLDIPDNGGFYSQKIDAALTPEVISDMYAKSRSGGLKRQQLG